MNEKIKIMIEAEISKLKKGVADAKKAVEKFTEGSEKGASEMDKAFEQVGNTMRGALAEGAKVATGAVTSITTALVGTSAATQEYRNEQAKLQTAFESAGSSAEQAKTTYNDLYRVLGDSGVATEASAHLAKLTQDQQSLSEWTNICQGVYATFGDSIPIEGLTEASNETAKTGQLTGALADALNWAGVNEDKFQESLEKCNSEAEREQLIRETLNGLYSEASATFEQNNADVLAQNEAQAKLTDTLAQLGEVMSPVVTAFTEFANDALSQVTPYIQELAEKYGPTLKEVLGTMAEKLGEVVGYLVDNWGIICAVAGVIGGITAAITLYNIVAAIKAAMAVAEVTTVWALVAAYTAQAVAMMAALAPYLLIVAAVALLVAGFLYLWENCEGFREFWIDLWEKMKDLFSKFVDSLKPLINAIVDAFKEAWELIKVVWDLVAPHFEGIWNAIKNAFSVVGAVLSGYFKVAWELIKGAWDIAVSYFTTLWNNIKLVFSVVKDVLSGNFKGAWESIKKIFSNWQSFFQGLWDKVKAIFTNVGQAIGDAVSGTVKTAINAVLSTAVSIINGFISAINLAISAINLIPGVSISKLNKLSVPKMAKGGIVDSATLAMIGENGKEAVMPLENNTGWMSVLADELVTRMGAGNGQTIVMQVDGKTFAEVSVNSINQLTKQRGSLPLKLY